MYSFLSVLSFFFFFFQAEDGIRDRDVTGVQTCALPIYFPCSMSDRPDRSCGSCRTGSGYQPTAHSRKHRSRAAWSRRTPDRSEEHTSELQSHHDLVCRLLLEKKKKKKRKYSSLTQNTTI